MARSRIAVGIVRPSALAALRLITSSNAVACWTRQIGRLLALENAAGVDADLAICSAKNCSVAHQAARRGEFAPREDCRNCMARRQQHELIAPAGEERLALHEEPGDPLFDVVATAASIS